MAVGNLAIEDYVPVVKNNNGLFSKLSVHFTGNVTIDGTLTSGSEVIGAEVITSTSANAFAVGPAGTTNPTFNVDASTASAATGLNIKSAAAASGVAVSVVSSGTNESITIDAKGSGTITLANTSTGVVQVKSRLTIQSTNGNALAVGANGLTNPVFRVDAATASVATGISITGAAAAAGVTVAVLSSGTDEALSVDAKGAGVIKLGSISTGQISIGRGQAKIPILSSTIASLGTTQSSTPTAAQLLGGVVTQTGATGAGTVTLPTGTLLSAAVTGVAVGDTFYTIFANLGGGQTLTITGATGSTVIGTAAITSAKNALMTFVNTGTNTWNVYVNASA